MCVYPQNRANIYEICGQQKIEGKEDKNQKESFKVKACRHYNCLNCCANLKSIYKMIILKYESESEKLAIKIEGYNKYNSLIKDMIAVEMIEECEYQCRLIFKFEEPQVNSQKVDETSLGVKVNSPAYHCRDIKDNNKAVHKTGIYFTKPINSQIVSKVYCDQDTEGGGWQLLFNYRHTKQQSDFQLDGTAYPLDPIYGVSHTTLQAVGYNFNEISELRFLCLSTHDNKFIHFITKNPKVIIAAFNEDTTSLTKEDWQSDLDTLHNQNLDEQFLSLFLDAQKIDPPFTVSDILKKISITNTENVN